MDINVFFQNFGRIFDQGRREDIGEFLHNSLAEAEKEKDNHALVTILNEAAGYFRNTSNYAEAVNAADRAVSILRGLGYENTVPYGTTLLNAATAYRAAGDSVKAMELFISSLTVLAALLPEDDYRLAGLYNNISAIHEEKGDYSEALEMLQKASDIMEKKPDMADDAAIVLTNLAMISLKLNRRDEASATLEKAMAVFRRAGGGEEGQKLAPQYAAALAGMGEAYFRMDKFDKAARAYESALEHIEAAFGENRDYAITCRNCADACEAAGYLEKARQFTAKADHIFARLDA
ncbi:MAG: tetratricopeptide repeat protein [Desulfovibrio sp.]|jgi:tetratricopeptide (TPR) repeat protein|nr:tetratricopeptide repeat protein [Desulfovibrio sp.]